MLSMIEMHYYQCWVCGIPFGLFEGFVKAVTQNHTTFFCPAGCKLAFGKSQADKLLEEKNALELRLQAEVNEANHLRLVAERARDKALRDKRQVERRIAHGVCPCCNKTFSDVTQHMITEHKEFRLPASKRPKEIEAPKTGVVQ